MIAIDLKSVTNVINKYKHELKSHQFIALIALKKVKKSQWNKLNNEERIYLTEVLRLFEHTNIVEWTSKELWNSVNILKAIPNPTPPTSKKKGPKPKILSKYIQEALNYKGLRSTFYAKFYKELEINACVYCNAQSTYAIDVPTVLKTKTRIDSKAKFQLDHFHSKSEYPHLCISVFNLYPVCGPCNQAKSNNPVKFNLYSDIPSEIDASAYSFKMKYGSITKYLLSKDKEDIKFSFIDPEKTDPNIPIPGSLFDTFNIQEIYETQKDIVEELIIKAQVYPESYVECLVSSFPSLFTHSSLSGRILVGNYTEPKDIHKRPMAKFTQDIAKQLKLI